MSKKTKKINKTLEIDSLGGFEDHSNPISSFLSLQIRLNELDKEFNHLADEYLILKHRLKSKLFSQTQLNTSNFLNIEYLKKFLNKNSDTLYSSYLETIQPIKMFSLEIDPEVIESIAKHAYLLLKYQSELGNSDFGQPNISKTYLDSGKLKCSSEFKILNDLNEKSPIPFLKTIIDKKYSQSLIYWQEFTYLYSQKKIVLIDNDKDESEKYYLDRASNSKISSINNTTNQIWTFNRKIWFNAMKYLENNDLPPNNYQNSFPFFNKYSNIN